MRSLLRASTPAGVLASAALLALSILAPAQRGGAGPGRGDAQAPAPEGGASQGRGGAQEPGPAPSARLGDRGGTRDGASGQGGAEPAPKTDVPLTERAPEFFAIADYNGNGRISFDEARQSLGVDRDGFAVYDKDGDGLVDFDEFRARLESVYAKGGAFQAPRKKPDARKPPRREAAELLAAYDQTPDGTLDARELKRALADYDVKEPPAEELFVTLDRDASKKLETVELEALADLLSPPKPSNEASAKPKPRDVIELFGRNVPREEREGATQLPPQILGPVPVFRRLDLDDDGQIELDDLTALRRPVQLHVRINAVFATLDTDGDGKLSPEEFAASMRPRRD